MHLPVEEEITYSFDSVVSLYANKLQWYLKTIIPTLEEIGKHGVEGMTGIEISIKTEKRDGKYYITHSVDNGKSDDIDEVNAARQRAINKLK